MLSCSVLPHTETENVGSLHPGLWPFMNMHRQHTASMTLGWADVPSAEGGGQVSSCFMLLRQPGYAPAVLAISGPIEFL